MERLEPGIRELLQREESAVEEEVERKLGKYLRKLVTTTMKEHGWSSTSSSASQQGRLSIADAEQATVTQNLLQTLERRMSNIETCMLYTRDAIDHIDRVLLEVKHALSSESTSSEEQQVPTTVCGELQATNKLLKLILITQCQPAYGTELFQRLDLIFNNRSYIPVAKAVGKITFLLDKI